MISRHDTHRHRGFIAIVTVILLCSIISALIFSVNTRAIDVLFSQTNYAHKEASRMAAKSCVYLALQNYQLNSNYSPTSESHQITPNTTCIINSIIFSNDILRLITTGFVENAYSQLLTTAVIRENSIVLTSEIEQ